jgi:hypothetical protein
LIDGSVFKECGNPFKNHPNSPEKKIPKIWIMIKLFSLKKFWIKILRLNKIFSLLIFLFIVTLYGLHLIHFLISYISMKVKIFREKKNFQFSFNDNLWGKFYFFYFFGKLLLFWCLYY